METTMSNCLVKKRLRHAAFRLEMAQVERLWAVASAKQQGLSVREIAAEMGLSPTRIHQLCTESATQGALEALSVLREVGWPAPEDPSDVDRDAAMVTDRLVDEAALLIACADWLEMLVAGTSPEVSLSCAIARTGAQQIFVDQGGIVGALRRIASDIDELVRAKRFAEVPLAGTEKQEDLFQACKAWENYALAHKNAGLPIPPNPYRHLDRSKK